MSVLTGGVTDALGWTLLHFVWQGALVALLLWCGLALMSGSSPRVRYGVCCLALLLMVGLPIVTFGHLGGFERGGAGTTVVAPWVLSIAALDGGAAHEPLRQRALEMLQISAPLLPWLWLVGVAVCAVRLGVGLAAARRLRNVGVRAVDGRITAVFADVADRVGVRRVVGLLESVRVEAPTVVGWLRPMVLLPACCFAGMSIEQMEALLAHELAHIRRHDYLVSVVQSVVEALLFYHPAVWWVSRQVRKERECCCDEVAAECCGDVLEYARALSWLEEQRLVGPVVGLGANGGVLHMRIRRVLGYREGSLASQIGAVAVLCVVMASATALLVREARAEKDRGPAVQTSIVSTESVAGKLAPEYSKWLNEDVVWIIMPEERDRFLAAQSDAERDRFIKLFWLQRDDQPGVADYSFRAQHYARMAYANAHFGGNGVPGWTTDRGRVYIVNGKPERIESHPNGGASNASKAEQTLAYPFEVWHYIRPTVADQDSLVFVDACRCGLYKLTADGIAGGASKAKKVETAPAAPVFQRASLSLGTSNGAGAGAQAGVGELDGVIVDPTGAVVARATVSVAGAQTGEHQTQRTDESGRYSFSVPAGRYTVDAAATGFRRTVAQNVQVNPADPVHMTLKLKVGAASEYMKVSSSAGPVAGASAAQTPSGPIRVSAGSMAGNAVSQAQPVYPPEAKANGVQGTVVLHALISSTGKVENLAVMSGPAELRGSALDAVKQWTYRPYLLNGQAVEVETWINVNYTLADPNADTHAEPPAVPGASRQSGRPVRVSAGVMAGTAITQVAPVYPDDAKAARVQGTVVLHAVVSKEGDIENLQVVSGPQELTQSAIDAVKQWKYKPYLLNGEPVEVETTVNVNYSLEE